MILPKDFFNQIEYFEHSMDHVAGTHVDDKFVIHFKAWWRRKQVIRIKRIVEDHPNSDGVFTHSPTPSAADLYSQLNNWATATFEEKLDSVKKKYETNDKDNVIQLKPKPKDMDDE